jgi:prepilin-type N-terminal cleavage/methylation domain-containing protein/prepilin-type processing-associated H-X9-DG protein
MPAHPNALPALPRRAFTLLEIIVAVGIILVLASLLLIALRGVTITARRAGCVTNMRQLGVAHAAYMGDHDMYFIDVGLPHGGAGDETIAWINTLRDYYDHELVLRSPLDTSRHWPPADIADPVLRERYRGVPTGEGLPIPPSTAAYRRSSYGFNTFLSRTLSPYVAVGDSRDATDRLTKVRGPATTVSFLVIVFEGPNAGTDHPHFESYWFAPGADYAAEVAQWIQTNAVSGPAASFGSVSNYAFLDGSVGTHAFSGVFVDTDTNQFDPAVSHLFLARRSLQ